MFYPQMVPKNALIKHHSKASAPWLPHVCPFPTSLLLLELCVMALGGCAQSWKRENPCFNNGVLKRVPLLFLLPGRSPAFTVLSPQT